MESEFSKVKREIFTLVTGNMTPIMGTDFTFTSKERGMRESW